MGASIATITGTLLMFFTNATASNIQNSSGDNSPNIQNGSGNININTTVNQKSGLFLKYTRLIAQPSVNSVQKQVCMVEEGSEIQKLDEKKDTLIKGAVWIKVKVLDGNCKGKEGWTGQENLLRK
jgi:hypothetical protein